MKVNYTDLLLEAGRLFHQAKSNKELFEIIVEYTNSALQPDLSCFYLNQKSDNSLKLTIKKGFAAVPKILMEQSELVSFLQESEEIICLNTRKPSPFADLLLSDTMESGLAVPLILGEKGNGVLTVRFTYRSSRIRIIGAGYWRKGKKVYEQVNSI